MGETALDGRVARGERTRRRVAEALIALLEDGVAEPTARQLAERAGVSPRIVFHHYEDMEQVLRMAVAIQAERHWSRLEPIDPALPLADRIDRLVRQRGTLFDAIAPVRRAAAVVEQRSPTVATELARSRRVLRREVRELFRRELPEAGRHGDLMAALEVAAGWDTWEQLRRDMGRSPAAARRVVTVTLTSLLATALPPTSPGAEP